MAHLRSGVAVRPLRPRGLVLFVALVLVGVIVAPAVAADQYSVVDLAPAQTVAYYGGPAAINASGAVAGSSGNPTRAFRYGTGFQTLGVLGGGASAVSYAYGINTAGWTVGLSSTGKNSPGPAHAFRHNGVSMTDLGVIKKGGSSAAYDINDQNLVVGETSVTGATHAFKYDTQLRDLGTLPGYLDSRAYAVNASGKIVGRAYGGTVTRAFLHDGTTMRDLGTLGGTFAEAYDINDTDIVVGYSSNGVATHAFRYQGTTMADITPTVAYAIAYAVNNTGDIVGTTSTSPSGNPGRAFLYRDGQLVDLNTLIPAGSGWILTDATDINDQGQITGIGTHNGERRTYRLDLTNQGLLERFLPEMRYDSLDTFRADSPAEMTNNTQPTYWNVLKDSLDTEIAASNGSLSLGYLNDVYPGGRHASSGDFLDANNGTREADAARMHADPTYGNKIYGQVVGDVGAERVVQYWFFYYFNYQPSLTNVGDHEGDWESIQIHLDPTGKPTWAVYSQHNGAERCAWQDVERTSSARPEVYVALGTHASYFRAGDHPYENGLLLDHAQGDVPVAPHQLVDITPPAPAWLDWPGRWGGSTSGEFASPVGPAMKGAQWLDPKTWGEQQAVGSCGAIGLAAARYPAPIIHAAVAGTTADVTYSIPGQIVSDDLPAVLLTSISGSDRRIPPIVHRQRVRSSNGSFSRPGPVGPGPYRIQSVLYTNRGTAASSLRASVLVDR